MALTGLGLLLIGSIGVFFGRMLQSAISRQRELLADASAVQFTRDSDGLVGALKKIGGAPPKSFLQTPRADEASHIFFSEAIRRLRLFSGLFRTHPPLDVQREILEIVSRVDSSLERLLGHIQIVETRSANLRSSILSAAFSGRLDTKEVIDV